ncbi:hypothetical protein FRC11_014620 [Ceratobasidium sp. 423]|nr:hypothetical protein FRC11_014620 [Ceratobasidium sp. 423]
MSLTSEKLTVESTIIQQWKEAGTLLSTAVSRFLDLSTLLETQCTTRDGSSSDLIIRIDTSLDHLQSTIDRQLTQARVSLAKTRNRLTKSVLRLPDEIISEIFVRMVYDPTDDRDPSAILIVMSRRVELIYRRLYSLLGVCASWRRVGLSTKALWSVIPFIDPHVGDPRLRSAGLSLERAGNEGLHLAVYLKKHTFPAFGPLYTHLHRFGAITISQEGDATFTAVSILRMFLAYGVCQSISKLCLENIANNIHLETRNHPVAESSKPLNIELAHYLPQFFQLLASLSTLRLHGLTLDWANTTFSNRLAVLQIGGISLGSQPIIDAFISALTSARELRELKLISIRAMPDEDVNVPVNGLVLPKLEFLHIEDLYFNVLDLFMKVLAPGPYHLTVNLHPAFRVGYVRSADDFSPQLIEASEEDICALLRTVEIDKLIIHPADDCLWTDTGLHTLLKSTPRVKTLIMNSYYLEQEVLKALAQPPRPPSSESAHGDLFPKLETIEFQCCVFLSPLGELKEGFRDLLASHPVKKMALGIYKDEEAEALLNEGSEVIEWLKTTVPQFQLYRQQTDSPDIISSRQLWDV